MDEVQRRGSAARLSYKKRFFAWLLCSVLVFGLMQPPPAKAVVLPAGLLAAGAVSVIGSVLISSGAQFKTQEALRAVSQDIYDRYIAPGGDLADEITNIVRAWNACQGQGIRGAINLSLRLWQAICGNPVAENLIGGYYGPWTSSNISSSVDRDTLNTMLESSLIASCTVGANRYDVQLDGIYINAYLNGAFYKQSKARNGQAFLYFLDIIENGVYVGVRPGYICASSFGGDGRVSVSFGVDVLYPFAISLPGDTAIPVSGDVVRPGEDDTVVALPDVFPRVGEDGTVEMPVLSLDKTDYLVNKDVLTAAGTQEDVVVDAATGQKVETGTGEQTDDKVGDVALEDIKAQEQSLGAVFISKFPFCIPWDVAKAVGLLAAPAEAPYWEVDFLAPMEYRVGGWKGDTTVVIDMGEYPIIGQACRWASTFMFVWALMLGTKRLIWTS